VLPYLPAHYISSAVSDEDRRAVRDRYRLPARYFFYPAQFWPHKNHFKIVQALDYLRQTRREQVHVVFSGSCDGEIRRRTFDDAMDMARKMALDQQIHYLGYVGDGDMSALYAEAVGLLMPTFFGPTNIPVLEAWQFGCPVITSDIRGIREQVGEAALLVDPRSVEAIGEAIWRLWDDDSLRFHLAERGRCRLQLYTSEEYRRRLTAIMREGVERTVV
jgi:glycosyltransferase involved in cell wall biosynthesis